MTRISNARVQAYFDAGDRAATARARGDALEDALKYIFCKIPGVRVLRTNAMPAAGGEEIDVVLWNDKHPDGLHFLQNVILFECKNWADPVGSPAVAFFCAKATTRHSEAAFLIAANGITGDEQDKTRAYQHIYTAFLQRKCHVIVLTRAELLALRTVKDLIHLIQGKIGDIVLQV